MKIYITAMLLFPFLLFGRIDTVYVQYDYHDTLFCNELTEHINDYFFQYYIYFVECEEDVEKHMNLIIKITDCLESTENNNAEVYADENELRHYITLCAKSPMSTRNVLHKIGHTLGWDHYYYINDKTIQISSRYLMNVTGSATQLCPYHNQWMREQKERYFDNYKKLD